MDKTPCKLTDFSLKMQGIFSGQKFIKNHFLNLLGLHIFRIFISKFFYNIRTVILFRKLTDEQKILRKDGIIFIENFLPKDELESIKKEFEDSKNFVGVYSEIEDGDSIWARRKFNRAQYANLPSTKKFLSNSRLLNLIYAGEARVVPIVAVWFDTVSYPKRETNGKHDSSIVESRHSDIFYPAHKVFYFPYDVKDEDGPLNFSRGSHKISARRLWIEYKKSIEAGRTESEDFFHVNDSESTYLKLKNIKAIVPENTLVVMNGCAFHKRGDAVAGAKRSVIFTQFRYNPFSLKTKINL